MTQREVERSGVTAVVAAGWLRPVVGGWWGGGIGGACIVPEFDAPERAVAERSALGHPAAAG